jgi:hypothetical protein
LPSSQLEAVEEQLLFLRLPYLDPCHVLVRLPSLKLLLPRVTVLPKD